MAHNVEELRKKVMSNILNIMDVSVYHTKHYIF